ncbi:DUF2199 domain-containing protein [Ascidiaceihabitans sp.]|uniref:DUF2199 domain-containing protein n=1 Tax=Ascidiaceihabitans sp. TaxID=1872644 RepID=UPI0032973D72
MIGWLKDRLFQKTAFTLDDDPRWKAFNNADHPCSCCGQSFNGIFDIGFDHPSQWPHQNRQASGEDILKVGDEYLSSDLCVVEDGQFVRGVLYIPVIGSDEPFGFGVWCSLHTDTFEIYAKNFRDRSDTPIEGAFGWMCNALPYYDTEDPLPSDVLFSSGNKRPLIELHDGKHPLVEAQRNGITFDTLLDIYKASGTDIRPHLER